MNKMIIQVTNKFGTTFNRTIETNKEEDDTKKQKGHGKNEEYTTKTNKLGLHSQELRGIERGGRRVQEILNLYGRSKKNIGISE